MARPREFDEMVVLEAIKNVFWRNGYEGTSYADLIDASGLHKGSLYAAFGDKRSLYLRALKAYDEYEVSSAVALLSGDGESALTAGATRIEALYNSVIEAVETNKDRRGCLLCNAAVDQAPLDASVETTVSYGMQRMQKAFENALKDRNSGQPLIEKANLANAVYFGMRVMAKSGAPLSMMKQTRNAAIKSLKNG